MLSDNHAESGMKTVLYDSFHSASLIPFYVLWKYTWTNRSLSSTNATHSQTFVKSIDNVIKKYVCYKQAGKGETGLMDAHSWREILASLCESQQKKQDVAERVGSVSLRTIDRWLAGTHKPQKDETIRKLAELSDEMRDALEQEFPEAFQSMRPIDGSAHISLPAEFQYRVVHAYAYVPRASRRWAIFRLVSTQMLSHLDPERTGLMILYAHPAPSRPDTVLFGEGAGNAFWTTRQVQRGMETDHWLVQSIAAGCPFFIQSCPLSGFSPPSCLVRSDLIQSVGFFPLYRSGIAAGGMLLCSTQEDFFTSLRQVLVEEYSCLLSLAFSDSDFSLALT